MSIRCYLLCWIVFISFDLIGQTGATPVYLKFRSDKIYIIDEQQVEVTADLYVGTSENPVSGLYSASLDLVFPTDVIAADLTFFKYYTTSFIGDSQNVEVFNKSPEALKAGHLNISISRNDGKSVSGFGKIGEVSFVIMGDIIGSRAVNETPFTVKAEYIKLLDVEGNELPHETDADGATIIIVNDILARDGGGTNTPQIAIYPNPASDQLYIQLQNLRGEQVEIFNISGQRVKQERVQGDQVRIDTKNLRPGLYTVKIHAEEGVITRRVLIQ